MLKRGDPPWHWPAFASVNEADANACPLRPVMVAPADALVVVAQFFARWSTPFENDEVGQAVLPGSNTHGERAAAAELAVPSAATMTAVVIAFLIARSFSSPVTL